MSGSWRPSSVSIERFQGTLAANPLRLDAAALALADHCSPDGADVTGTMEALDALAEAISEPTLDGVVRLLYRDMGFVGDRENYYDPENSLLDRVVERRQIGRAHV